MKFCFFKKEIFLLFFSVISIYSQEKGNDIVGKIQVLRNDNFLNIKAEVVNEGVLFLDELDYNLVALKKDEKGNYSNNKQVGEFSLKPNEKKELAFVRLSVGSKEELKAFLFIKHKGKLVSRDTFSLGVKKQMRVRKKINEASFFLKGLVIDEAITKIGKDFYDFLYQKYLLSGIKYPFIIKVKEKPGLTRTTVISVLVGDELIHEFRSNPNEDYIKQHVVITLSRLRFYSRKRQKIKSYKI